ncbi:dihydrolipoamide acetyltransferase family protein [Leekyejoonella antrihumi]|uniref:Dihydrolipoamide acetyltransferase component of pyruvate dehydrogenase complex n=1 Tax=Leekyejoonella antrihumi TaxID=1660198 RepID=A0A563E601_9MICO|nr:dihydrolipoamide acetyltransferase family protein [Leekyejoonella antrihumi]TWP37946.1 2-oxo acid dehydrogenase subunit E2 [Leekyejoonella antrihumi]
MGKKLFNLPDPGEGLVEAEIVTWKVKPGDTVKTNDVVVEIETAKSLVELPIPWSGTVQELLVQEGTTVEVGAPIVAIEVEGALDDAPAAPAAAPAPASDEGDGERVANLVGYGPSAGSSTRRARKTSAPASTGGPAPRAGSSPASGRYPQARPPARPSQPAPPAPIPAGRVGERPAAGRIETPGRPLAKPPVRKFAKDNGIDLSQVVSSREDGVISRADLDAHIAGAGARGAAAYGERETRVPIKGVRKMTAQAMVGSAFTAPHVSEFVAVDMTRTMELVERLKADREFRDVKVTPLLVLARALVIAVKRNPGVNATWDDAAQEIVLKHYVNLGIAASTPRGLVVPNIKDADRMTMRELADALGDLVGTAREGRTQPADMAGGTITITNVGVFGVDTGTPIINPGESAIVCFGQIRKMPWVVTDADGNDTIVPRQVTQLGVSFDHRLVDGDLGSRFLADIAALLEDPARALVWG